MTKSLRTYRLLRVLVAATLLFSMSLPLVRYACAMTGLSRTAPMAGVLSLCLEHTAAGMSDMKGCADVASALCPEEGPCPYAEACRTGTRAADAAACCSSESAYAEKAPMADTKLAPVHVVLPLVAILTGFEAVSSTSYPFLTHEPLGDPGGGVPLRVLHASFLL